VKISTSVEVLAEALPDRHAPAVALKGAYEQLKTLSRGHAVTRESLHAFIESCRCRSRSSADGKP